MRTILAILAIVMLLPVTVSAAPWLVSDPALASDNITSCVFESFQLPCTLDDQKAIYVDVGAAALPAATHSVRAKFCSQGGLWCSDWSSFFTFTKPSLSTPKNPKLLK